MGRERDKKISEGISTARVYVFNNGNGEEPTGVIRWEVIRSGAWIQGMK